MTVAYGRTRTLAKLFAETSKPFGAVAVTDPDHERELLARLPVTEIAGIGGRRAARLAPYGITTCLDLAQGVGPAGQERPDQVRVRHSGASSTATRSRRSAPPGPGTR